MLARTRKSLGARARRVHDETFVGEPTLEDVSYPSIVINGQDALHSR
jgi:hypothetical protein